MTALRFKSPCKTYPSLTLTEDDLAVTETAIRRAARALADQQPCDRRRALLAGMSS